MNAPRTFATDSTKKSWALMSPVIYSVRSMAGFKSALINPSVRTGKKKERPKPYAMKPKPGGRDGLRM